MGRGRGNGIAAFSTQLLHSWTKGQGNGRRVHVLRDHESKQLRYKQSTTLASERAAEKRAWGVCIVASNQNRHHDHIAYPRCMTSSSPGSCPGVACATLPTSSSELCPCSALPAVSMLPNVRLEYARCATYAPMGRE
jgi:hypothetical protein